MSTLKISAKGIDEVNFVYKRIKKEYTAVGAIKLNHDTMEYELVLANKELDSWLKSVCDKVIDMNDLFDGESIEAQFSWESLNEDMKSDKCPVQLNVLKKVWNEITSEKQWACYVYLCEELEIEISSLHHAIVD